MIFTLVFIWLPLHLTIVVSAWMWGDTVRPIFRWHDLWVGFYYDRPNRRIYAFPIPCCGYSVTIAP